MSRSEDPIIVRAELGSLDSQLLIEWLVPAVITSRHHANTIPPWLAYIRDGGCSCDACDLARHLDRAGLLEDPT